MGRLVGDDARELADVEVETRLDGGKLLLRVMVGKGCLLDYYFHQGRRRVTFEDHGTTLDGWLRTSWSGGRRHWAVQLTAMPAEVVPQEALQVA